MGSSSKLRVIVVEDNIAMSDLFKKELRKPRNLGTLEQCRNIINKTAFLTSVG
jgi:hypothetical protein